jgi:hypothetical protein
MNPLTEYWLELSFECSARVLCSAWILERSPWAVTRRSYCSFVVIFFPIIIIITLPANNICGEITKRIIILINPESMVEAMIHLGLPNPKVSAESLKSDPCVSQFGSDSPVFFSPPSS